MVIKFFNDAERMEKLIGILLAGLEVTGRIFALTLLISIPLGIIVALGRMSKVRVIRWPISIYIYIMRGTPLMLQVLFFYFLLPKVVPIRLDRFWWVIVAFAVNYAAYFAEIFRGGIQSISDGQSEAGQVLGFTKMQVFMRIVLPQAFKRVVPPVTNEVITLVKDTALASIIAVEDLMTKAKGQVSSSGSVEPYLVAAIIYLIVNGIVEQACRYLERRLNYYK